MTKDEGWKSERYSSADARDSLQLMRRALGGGEVATPGFLEWQFEGNPAGTAVSLLVRDEGRLVGQATTIPISVMLSGKGATAGLSLDPVIDPDYRGRSLAGGLLLETADLAAKEDIAFSYGSPEQAALSSFLKQGEFKDVGALPLLIRPLNPERLATKAADTFGSGRPVSIARSVWRTPPPKAQKEDLPGLEIGEEKSFDEPFALFWHRVHQRFPIMVVRDPAYLNWRFVNVPGRKYTSFAARSEGKIRGYVVVRATQLERFSVGLIVDLVVEASGEGRAAGRHLVDHVKTYLREQDLDMLATVALRHTDEYRIFRSRGFWVLPKFLEPRPFHLVVRSHAAGSEVAYDLKNWFLTPGDSLGA
jgi:GNAT superfamily N-acetyltransferase